MPRAWLPAALLFLAAAPALADGPDLDEGKWNVGAGLSANLALATATVGTGTGTTTVSVPGVVIDAERRVGRATWLAIGLVGGAGNTTQSSGPPVSGGTTSTSTDSGTTTTLGVTAGLRQVLTSTSPVEVSVFGNLAFGYSSAHSTSQSLNSTTLLGVTSSETNSTTDDTTAFAFGFTAGFAFDRKLIDHLHLRLALALVDVSVDPSTGTTGSSTTIVEGNMTTTTSAAPTKSTGLVVNAGLVLEPALTLRYIF